jgi:NTP pyrophosphatase (non-canonical NTP hydrolase)
VNKEDADRIITHLKAAGFGPDFRIPQVIALAEETGEFVKAARRYLGLARRSGTFRDVEDELADVIITAWVTASAFDVDLEAAVADKLHEVMTRGWREWEPRVTNREVP